MPRGDSKSSRSQLFQGFLTGLQDRKHLSGFAASRTLNAMDVLPGVPAVDQPIQQISLSHKDTASLTRPYGQPTQQSMLRRNLSIRLASEITGRGGYPS